MSSQCSQKCLERPDAVDKINWKCVECKTDLKPVYDELQIKIINDLKKKAEDELLRLAASGELTEEEKADRRAM